MNEQREPEEEPVEDLDPPEEDAENVKGGTYNWYLKVEGGPPPPPPPRP